jgi:predicted ArsR family transcriptional regulator
MCGSTTVDFWGELDAEVLRCLAGRSGDMTLVEIGHKLGISEQAVRSIVGMLAEAGKVRVSAVELVV